MPMSLLARPRPETSVDTAHIKFAFVISILLFINGYPYFYLKTYGFFDCGVDAKRFKPNINVVHLRDLNFVLQSEIFVHFNDQLWASYLILSCTPAYTSF